jgi:hypothetical protein
MRLAAARKAGTRPRQNIFDAAGTRGATVQRLGDALTVKWRFPDVQLEAGTLVQRACVDLTQRGDEARIPETADLFEGYGGKALAEAYLNSGQPDLEAAARTWAGRRSYTIGTGAAPQQATRGSRR